MAWRRAKSLDVLGAEVHVISPKTTIYDIGDAAHQAQASDHNPNAEGVVCAIDIMQGHTDLRTLAEKIRASGHPDLAYLIYDRRIANRKTGFRWTAYGGSNPHTDHIHVSVGVGTDGRRKQPYDDTVPWGVAPAQEDDMPLLINALDTKAVYEFAGIDPPTGKGRLVGIASMATVDVLTAGGAKMTTIGTADPKYWVVVKTVPGVECKPAPLVVKLAGTAEPTT